MKKQLIYFLLAPLFLAVSCNKADDAAPETALYYSGSTQEDGTPNLSFYFDRENSQLVGFEDHNGSRFGFRYTRTFLYNGLGNIDSVVYETERNQRWVETYLYDAQDRLVEVKAPGYEQSEFRLSYDGNSVQPSRKTFLASGLNGLYYRMEYDAAGNLTRLYMGDNAQSEYLLQERSYDSAPNRYSTIPSYSKVRLGLDLYSSVNNLTSIQVYTPSGQTGERLDNTYTFNAEGLPERNDFTVTLPDGSISSNTLLYTYFEGRP